MLIRTNCILKLDLLFTEKTTTNSDIIRANSMNTSIIIRTIATMMNSHDSIQRYMLNTNNINAKKKKNDSKPKRIFMPDNQRSSFICFTDQDKEEEDETQAQTTSFSCSSSSESIFSKTTITNNFGIHQYASTNCSDAATLALIEKKAIFYQSDDNDDNEETEDQLNYDWMIQGAADNDAAADYVDQGSFVSSMNLNQYRIKNDEDSNNLHKKRQKEEEWFKGTLFYEDPGTPPLLPPKDYLIIDYSIYFSDEQKFDQDSQQPTSSPSLYSLAISSKIGTSIKSRHKTITGKVRNAFKRKSMIFSRA